MIPVIYNMPQMQPFYGAGWVFARGHFFVNVPYDLHAPMVFFGEEISMAIRAFTYGYDHYGPLRNISYHSYAKGVKNERSNVNK